MEWYRRWFGEDYLLVYGHRDDAEAERDIRFVERALGLEPGALVLDLCSGPGRHALPLARSGCRAVGLDSSRPLLTIARDAKKPGECFPLYVCADSRALPFRDSVFDAVLNLFTSFGYFDHCENCGMLASISRVLKPDGAFLIDYLNPSRLLAGLVPESVRERNGLVIVEKREFDTAGKRVEKTITIRSRNGERFFRESVRLYTLAEMRTMLGEAGLEIEGVAGSMEGEPYGESSERMILWGRRGMNRDPDN
jgi:ubiquinone/menaquinone biosynthesis C-methylase UbiE